MKKPKVSAVDAVVAEDVEVAADAVVEAFPVAGADIPVAAGPRASTVRLPSVSRDPASFLPVREGPVAVCLVPAVAQPVLQAAAILIPVSPIGPQAVLARRVAAFVRVADGLKSAPYQPIGPELEIDQMWEIALARAIVLVRGIDLARELCLLSGRAPPLDPESPIARALVTVQVIFPAWVVIVFLAGANARRHCPRGAMICRTAWIDFKTATGDGKICKTTVRIS